MEEWRSMKDIAHWLNRYKLRNRVILAYMALSVVTALVLSLTLYQLLAGKMLESIGENSLLSLKQSASAADMLQQQVLTLDAQLLVDRDVQNFIYMRKEDKVVTYRASLALSRLLSAFPFIQSIELYNSQADVYFNTMNPGLRELPALKEYTRGLYGQTEVDKIGRAHV
jgi:uncharacterized protein YigA (DUF484 family)